MMTALSAPDSALDDSERRFVAGIREHGWFQTDVFAEGDRPGFSFTTGFWVTLGKPELIVFGFRSEIANGVFRGIFQDLAAGREFPVGSRTPDVFAGLDAFLLPMDPRQYADHLGWSLWFYGGEPFPCLQLAWPDRSGRFPWEPDVDAAVIRAQTDVSDGGWASYRN